MSVTRTEIQNLYKDYKDYNNTHVLSPKDMH